MKPPIKDPCGLLQAHLTRSKDGKMLCELSNEERRKAAQWECAIERPTCPDCRTLSGAYKDDSGVDPYLFLRQKIAELHALIFRGEGDQADAEKIREAMDPYWGNLSEPERRNIKGYSALFPKYICKCNAASIGFFEYPFCRNCGKWWSKEDLEEAGIKVSSRVVFHPDSQ